jgi:hypothetical protein
MGNYMCTHHSSGWAAEASQAAALTACAAARGRAQLPASPATHARLLGAWTSTHVFTTTAVLLAVGDEASHLGTAHALVQPTYPTTRPAAPAAVGAPPPGPGLSPTHHYPRLRARPSQLDLGGERVLPLAKFRGQVRPVIVAGNRAFVDKALKEAERQYTSLRERGVSAVPVVFDAPGSPPGSAKEVDPEEKIRALKRELESTKE